MLSHERQLRDIVSGANSTASRIPPVSLAPGGSDSPASVGTFATHDQSSEIVHIGGYDSESVRDLYTSERSPSIGIMKAVQSSESDMLYFDGDDAGSAEVPDRGARHKAIANHGTVIPEQPTDSEMTFTQPFTVPRDMNPLNQDPTERLAADLKHPEKMELDGLLPSSEYDISGHSSGDDTYQPGRINEDFSKKRQRKPSTRKTKGKKCAAVSAPEGASTETQSLQLRTLRPRKSLSQTQATKPSEVKSLPKSNLAKKVYASRATQFVASSPGDTDIPATQPISASASQLRPSAKRIPKKSFLDSDDILVEDSDDAAAKPEPRSTHLEARGKSFGTAAFLGARRKTKNTSSQAKQNVSTKNTQTQEGLQDCKMSPKTDLATTADPFEIEASPEPKYPIRSKGGKPVDHGGKKNEKTSGGHATKDPKSTAHDGSAIDKVAGAIGPNSKKKRISVGYEPNSGRSLMAKKFPLERHEMRAGEACIDHKGEIRGQQELQVAITAQEETRGDATAEHGTQISTAITGNESRNRARNSTHRTQQHQNLAEGSETQRVFSLRFQDKETSELRRRTVRTIQSGKAQSQFSGEKGTAGTINTPARPGDILEAQRPKPVRHISVSSAGSPVPVDLCRRGDYPLEKTKKPILILSKNPFVGFITTVDGLDPGLVKGRLSQTSTPQGVGHTSAKDPKCENLVSNKAQTVPIHPTKGGGVRFRNLVSSSGPTEVPTHPELDHGTQIPARRLLAEIKQQSAIVRGDASRANAFPDGRRGESRLAVDDTRRIINRQLGLESGINEAATANWSCEELAVNTRLNEKEVNHPEDDKHGNINHRHSSFMDKLKQDPMAPKERTISSIRHIQPQTVQEPGEEYHSATDGSKTGRPTHAQLRGDPRRNSLQAEKAGLVLTVHPKTLELARKIRERGSSQSGTRQEGKRVDFDNRTGQGRNRDCDLTSATQEGKEKHEKREKRWKEAVENAHANLSESMHDVVRVSFLTGNNEKSSYSLTVTRKSSVTRDPKKMLFRASSKSMRLTAGPLLLSYFSGRKRSVR